MATLRTIVHPDDLHRSQKCAHHRRLAPKLDARTPSSSHSCPQPALSESERENARRYTSLEREKRPTLHLLERDTCSSQRPLLTKAPLPKMYLTRLEREKSPTLHLSSQWPLLTKAPLPKMHLSLRA